MGFLTPWFLAGALTVGLPVYVHLLRRRKTVPVPFSSLMFFEKGTQSSTRHRRLRYLLLFGLRTAVLLLLALAFASPFVRRPAAMASDRLLLIVVDDSLSMRSGDRLTHAKREALDVLASRHPGQRAQVMLLDERLTGLTQPIEDSRVLNAAVRGIESGEARSNYGELGRGVKALALAEHAGIEVHLFTDVQRSSVPGDIAEMVMPEGVALHLHAMADRSEPNWSVISVDAPAQVADPTTARVHAVVAGFHTPAASREVSLLVEGRKLATKTVALPPNGMATVDFTGLDVPYGLSRCSVRVEASDALSADNERLFAVRRSDPEHILFVHAPADTRSSLYFGAAIAAATHGAYLLQPMTPESTSDTDPTKYAFVVLADVASLPSHFEDALRRYLAGGGNLLMLVGSNAGRQRRLPVLGATLGEPHVYARTGDVVAVGQVDATYAPMRENSGLADAHFAFASAIDPGNSRVVARLSDQTPLLMDFVVGEGHAMVFASGFDNLTNDLPLTSAFVPLVDQTARYLSGSGRLSGARNVGDSIQLRQGVSASSAGNSVDVLGPGGARPLSLAEAAHAQTLELRSAGFYRIRFANGRDGLIGVNPDGRESNLEILPPEMQQLWAGGATPSDTQGRAGAPPEATVRVSMWWYVMVLAFAMALAESVVAGNYLGTQREEA